MGHGPGKQPVGQEKEPGNADAGGNAEFGGADVAARLELEVAHETEVQGLPSLENIPVEEGQLGRNPEEADGVGGTLQVDLEPFQFGYGKIDVTVDPVIAGRGQPDIDGIEKPQGGKPAVGVGDHVFVVGISGPDHVQVLQDFLVDFQRLRIIDVDLSEMEFFQFPGRIRVFVAGMLIHPHFQVGQTGLLQGVRFKEKVILVETEIAQIAEIGGGTDRFRLQRFFGEPVPRPDGDVDRIPVEIFGESASLREDIADIRNFEAVAQVDFIDDPYPLAPDVDLGFDGGAVVSQILQVAEHVGDGRLDLVGVVDDRCRAEFVPETVFLARPVVDIHGRRHLGFLFDVRLQ